MFRAIAKWSRPPVFPENEDKTRNALLLNVILITFILALPVVFVGAILGGDVPRLERILIIIACAWLTIFAAKFTMQTGRVAAAGVITVAVIFTAATLAIYNLGTIRAPATSFYLLTIVMAGLTIGRRAIIWMAGISAVAIIAFLIAEKNGLLPPPSLAITITQGITFTVVFVVVSILLYLAVKSLDEALTRARNELTERRHAEAVLRQFSGRLEIIHDIDRALLSARSAQEIALGALARIRQLIPSPRASVSLFDLNKREAVFLAADFENIEDIDHTPISFQEFGQRVIDELIQNKPWMISDITLDPQATELDKRLARNSGIRAWLSLPLMYQGELIGALNLGRSIGEQFSSEDAEIALDVANQLAIAIRHLGLYTALQNELAEKQKLIPKLESYNAELERFTYTVSHDLKNPLVTIKGFLGMLDKDIQDQQWDRVQVDFQRIANAADKMHILISDLLELSRIGRTINPPETVDLVKLTQESVETLDARIRSRNARVTISPDLPTVFGDRIRLREVLENLIDNAAKYTSDQSNPIIEIGARDQGEGQIFFVRDNGIGIEPQYQQKVFGLFEKLNPASEGTGVGLALVKRIIETHGGKIWVESTGLGNGSTFCFTIPDGRNQ